jgi:hypothetical protein
MILVKLIVKWNGPEGTISPCIMSVQENGRSFTRINDLPILHCFQSVNDIYRGYRTDDWEIVDIERIIDTARDIRHDNRN